MADRAAGFCVYNDCAVAISWLLDHGFERIAYVDVDVHHGDGVQAAFYDDPRVLTISLHQHPLTLWPGTGWPGEYGERRRARATRSTCRCRRAPRDAGWLRAFHAVVPVAAARVPPADPGHPVRRGHPRRGPAGQPRAVRRRAPRDLPRRCASWPRRTAGGKWLALGGGGYGLFRVVPRSWTHLLATVLDRDVDPRRPMPGRLDGAHRPAHPGAAAHRDDATAPTPRHEPWSDGAATGSTPPSCETRRAVFPLHGLDPDDPRD